MSQLRQLGALRRGSVGVALGLRRTPLVHGQRQVPLLAAVSAVSTPLSFDNRHYFSTSDATPTLELTVADGQLTDVAAAVAGNGTGHEPWAIVQAVQTALDAVHTTTGLPWWATLLLSGVALRATIFPFYVYQIRATQRLMQASPDFRKLYSAYKYARTFMPNSDQRGHINAILLGKKGVDAVMKKYNTNPVQTIMGSIAYIPIFILTAYSARDMVRSGNYAGFETGGFFFWKNLLETDSTFVLPILAAMSTYSNLELSIRTKSGVWTWMLQAGQYGSLIAIPLLTTLPQGVFFYWLGSSWSSMAQTLAMSNNDFRRRIGLKPRITQTQSPAAAAADDLTGGEPPLVNEMPAAKSQQQ
ncbi:Cytochrome c oxidase assembly protein cox18, mitochondrial [Phytophthora boehmeriae]|uniref:Cytochrome c oxidase assembly protein cox18, mitochondrial n=1 Tax=Phytophthora boehmeriae TaxID=109152 RepID=A0A8T1WTF6_9STRA|nr:Cytochrome c oxidase assembly protein cox18, mitochondrial [Phytophthora boehmeriae]